MVASFSSSFLSPPFESISLQFRKPGYLKESQLPKLKRDSSALPGSDLVSVSEDTSTSARAFPVTPAGWRASLSEALRRGRRRCHQACLGSSRSVCSSGGGRRSQIVALTMVLRRSLCGRRMGGSFWWCHGCGRWPSVFFSLRKK